MSKEEYEIRAMTPLAEVDRESPHPTNLASVVQGTAESLLSKLEASVAASSISARGPLYTKSPAAPKSNTR